MNRFVFYLSAILPGLGLGFPAGELSRIPSLGLYEITWEFAEPIDAGRLIREDWWARCGDSGGHWEGHPAPETAPPPYIPPRSE